MALQNIAFFLWWIRCWKQSITTKAVFTCTVFWRKCTKCDALTGRRSVSRWRKVSSVVLLKLQSLFKGRFYHFSPQAPWHMVVPKSTTCWWCGTDIIHPWCVCRQRRVWDLQGEVLNRNIVAIKARRRSRSSATGVSSARFKGNAKLFPAELCTTCFSVIKSHICSKTKIVRRRKNTF